ALARGRIAPLLPAAPASPEGDRAVKLKLSLQRSELPPIDLVATVDGATTVGDLADYVARSDPRGSVIPEPDLTLGVVNGAHHALDRRLTIAESGLVSGAAVTLSRGGDAYEDP